MSGDDRIVTLFAGFDPLMETDAADETAATHSDGGQGARAVHLAVNQVEDMRLRATQFGRNLDHG